MGNLVRSNRNFGRHKREYRTTERQGNAIRAGEKPMNRGEAASKNQLHQPSKPPRAERAFPCFLSRCRASHLTVAAEREGVESLLNTAARRSLRFVLGSLSAESARLLSGCGESAQLAVLHDRSGDPVDTRIVADSRVVRINKDNLEILVRSILVDPVRVENTEVAATTSHSLLGLAAKRALPFELIDSLSGRLSEYDTLRHSALATTAAHASTVDHITLLGLVAETAGLVRTRRTGSTVDSGKLTVLPASDAKQKLQYITLLFLPQLLEILVGTHLSMRSQSGIRFGNSPFLANE
jgi:hypothetical protein